MSNIADQLVVVGEPVTDDNLCRYILNGLGLEFNSFVVTITTRVEPIKFADLRKFLLTHENLLTTQSCSFNSSLLSSQNPTAFVSHPRPGSHPTYQPPRPNCNPKLGYCPNYNTRPNYNQRPNSQQHSNSQRSNYNPAPLLPNPPHKGPLDYSQPNNIQPRPYNPDRGEIC